MGNQPGSENSILIEDLISSVDKNGKPLYVPQFFKLVNLSISPFVPDDKNADFKGYDHKFEGINIHQQPIGEEKAIESSQQQGNAPRIFLNMTV